MPTREQCQRLIFKLGLKLGVSPKLISSRLLSVDDKNDMLSGIISTETLQVAVKLWKEIGMPDCANGNLKPLDTKLRR